MNIHTLVPYSCHIYLFSVYSLIDSNPIVMIIIEPLEPEIGALP